MARMRWVAYGAVTALFGFLALSRYSQPASTPVVMPPAPVRILQAPPAEDPNTLKERDPVPVIFERFLETRRTHLFVVDGDNRFVGAISLHDIKHVLTVGDDLPFVLAADILLADFPHVGLQLPGDSSRGNPLLFSHRGEAMQSPVGTVMRARAGTTDSTLCSFRFSGRHGEER